VGAGGFFPGAKAADWGVRVTRLPEEVEDVFTVVSLLRFVAIL
jgi:hypothetical protein